MIPHVLIMWSLFTPDACKLMLVLGFRTQTLPILSHRVDPHSTFV
jgi:hypothetical protein